MITQDQFIKANQLKAFTPFKFHFDNFYKTPVRIEPCKLNNAMLCFYLLNGVVIRINSTLPIIARYDNPNKRTF